jgi:hypothetical protein
MKRRIPKYAALMTMLALGLTAAFVIGGPVASAQGKGTCIEGGTKIDNPGNFEVINVSGITQVSVKAGNDCFYYPPDAGQQTSTCYTVTGLGTSTVTVTKVGAGPVCKDISHIEYTTGTTPPPTTSTVTTPPSTSTT